LWRLADLIDANAEELTQLETLDNGKPLRVARAADIPGSAEWTRDISKAHILAAKLKAGTAWVNTYGGGDPGVPFGGYKQSGWGRERGDEVLELYTQTKSVVVKL
jgi:acyl-CoA reductase-like NAD-dependent aldehyde dehydrogenase